MTFAVGLYFPSSTDPNIGTSESTVLWSNKWAIVPETNPATPPDNTKDYVDHQTVGTANEYVNFMLKRSTETSFGSKPTGATTR